MARRSSLLQRGMYDSGGNVQGGSRADQAGQAVRRLCLSTCWICGHTFPAVGAEKERNATASHAERVEPSKHIQKVMSKADGRSPATAYKVSSVRDEYEIISSLGLKKKSQSLVIQRKPFDRVDTTNGAGELREVWFDISGFYPEF